MQRVDPFIPVTKPQTRRPFPGLVNNVPRPKKPMAGSSMDGFVRRRVPPTPHTKLARERIVHQPHPTATSPRVSFASRQTTHKIQTHAQPAQTKRSWLAKLEPVLAFAAVVTAGFLLQSVVIGEALLAAYAIYAFIRQVPSRTTFTLALLAFLGIVAILVLRGTTQLAVNFSVYAFLLLAIGTATLVRELYTNQA